MPCSVEKKSTVALVGSEVGGGGGGGGTLSLCPKRVSADAKKKKSQTFVNSKSFHTNCRYWPLKS